jgi:outer membrane protein TolC
VVMKHHNIMFVKLYQPGLLVLLLCLFSNTIIAQNRNLDFYLSEGLANSPLLKDYQNQVASNFIDSQRLRATFKPQVAGISNNTYAPVINGWGFDPVLSNIASFNELVNVNQTFIGRKNLHTQYHGINLVSDSVRNAQKLSEQDLKRNITAQYITAYGDLQQLNFYAEVNNILRNQEIILKKLTQNNIYRQTDYLTFLVTMKQQELQLKQLQIQFRNDFSMLNYLCGIFDTSAGTLDPPEITLNHLPDAATSVFFLRYTTDSLILANDINILNYSYHPRLNAFANAGFSSSFLYQAYKNFGFNVGMNLNIPIYDGHQRVLQQKKIQLLENTNLNYKDFFTRQYDQQIAMLRQQLAGTESLISDINDQIQYAEGLIKVNGKLLETGDTKIADFVIAINNYLTAKNLLTQNYISRLQVINQINYWNR